MIEPKRSVLLLFVLLLLTCNTNALFGRKKRKAEREAAARDAALLEQPKEQPAGEGKDDDFILGIPLTSETLLGFLSAFVVIASACGISAFDKSKSIFRKDNKTADVLVVGMGLPKKGMGWYHLSQLLEMPQANVIGVVEPFFLNPDLCKSPPQEFTDFVEASSAVPFYKSIDELEEFTNDTLCLIAGRTSDNPKFFEQCVKKGAKVIFLEKPGAPSVAKLEEMKNLADSKGVKVYLGYNKNVTPYVQKALKLSNETKGSHVLFRHNNSYKVEDLPECFARNSEGMLKNMAIHELALLVSFFDVTTETIESFVIDRKNSEKLTVDPGKWLPSAKSAIFQDFSRIKFTVTTKSNKSVSVMADRCGGNTSYAAVLGPDDAEVGKFEFPDAADIEKVNAQVKADRDMMPYFFVQSDDYLTLKTLVIDSMIHGKVAANVATIDVGIEALKLAEYGTAECMKAVH
eukprot:CAMPEP_0116010920 /NCGR_PEP_ID=MMETSP0321-20121206/4271_1 /TAXON_ID=163516 /ORGANISM="Leptocylindrus danicus var. danicus, Strain B650" /LENGTH=459 /DNA_ID=CAMNT_0003480077 /DNA_START=65 /DNA_END=1444 /DNA_ORIENTATION=+